MTSRADAIATVLGQLGDADHRALRAAADDRTRAAVMACAVDVALHRPLGDPGLFLAIRYGRGHSSMDRLLTGGVSVDYRDPDRNPITLSFPELVNAWAKTAHAHGAAPGGTLRSEGGARDVAEAIGDSTGVGSWPVGGDGDHVE